MLANGGQYVLSTPILPAPPQHYVIVWCNTHLFQYFSQNSIEIISRIWHYVPFPPSQLLLLFYQSSPIFVIFSTFLHWVLSFRFLLSGTLMRVVAARMASRHWCPFFSVCRFFFPFCLSFIARQNGRSYPLSDAMIVDDCLTGIHIVHWMVKDEGLPVSVLWCIVYWARLSITAAIRSISVGWYCLY